MRKTLARVLWQSVPMSRQRVPSKKGRLSFQGACRGMKHEPRAIHVVVNPLNLCLSDAPLTLTSRTGAGHKIPRYERETTRKEGYKERNSPSLTRPLLIM